MENVLSMSSGSNNRPPIQIGALLRLALDDLRRRIHEGVTEAGFDDVRPAHTTLFRWPGPDGRRPTEIAADVQISKQRVNDLLRDLEQLSYLRLDRDPSDNRARIVRLTRRGKRLHQAAIAAHTELEDEWCRAVGPAAYAQLRHALAQITGA
jgi:DNA-binding MarR family transcriptional regulator